MDSIPGPQNARDHRLKSFFKNWVSTPNLRETQLLRITVLVQKFYIYIVPILMHELISTDALYLHWGVQYDIFNWSPEPRHTRLWPSSSLTHLVIVRWTSPSRSLLLPPGNELKNLGSELRRCITSSSSIAGWPGSLPGKLKTENCHLTFARIGILNIIGK